MSYSTPWYYSFAITILKPVYHFVLWRRHKKSLKNGNPAVDFKSEIDARFGRAYPDLPVSPEAAHNNVISSKVITSNNDEIRTIIPYHTITIWCHAVSLGETNTIAGMLDAFLDKGAKVWLTNTTHTGYARAETLFKDAIARGQLVHTFVPVDDKKVIKRFIEHVKPNLALFVETELWATTLEILAYHNIDAVLVNGRLSQKSYERYKKFAAVSQSMMYSLSLIIAQDEESAKRFRQLGADAKKIRIADSLKWSTGQINKDDTQTNKRGEGAQHLIEAEFIEDKTELERPIWVAGSTHEGEEALVLDAHKQLLEHNSLKNSLLIIVPRHPERFDDVAKLIEKQAFNYARRSLAQKITAETQVYLADTMGELPLSYQMSDVAFVGGSLIDDIGGHNPIEAASFAKPIVMGPYTFSCDDLVQELQQANALKVVEAAGTAQDTAHQLKTIVKDWLIDKALAKKAGENAHNLVADRSNAMSEQLNMIESLLISKVKTVDSVVKLVVKDK